jgi:hypothetical protein
VLKSLLIAALFAAAPPPPQAGTVIDASKYAVPSTTDSGDAAAPSQAILDALPQQANAVVRFDRGQRYLGRPLVVTKDNVTLDGVGMALSGFQPSFTGPAFLVGPLGDQAADGFLFSAGGRPDVTAMTDGSMGLSRGFATQGRSVLYVQGSAAQLGGYTAAKFWDYWRGGCTIEFLLRGKYTPGDPILGWGSNYDPVGPGCLNVSADGTNALTWYLALEGETPAKAHAVTFRGIDWTAVNRIRLWYDPVTGTAGCWVNGKDLAGSWYGEVPNFAGKVLKGNIKDYPFHLGQYGTVSAQASAIPDAVFAGLCLSNVPVKADAGNDKGRYQKNGPGVVVRLATETTDPGRLVRLMEGAAATGRSAFGLALDAKSPPMVSGFTASNFHVDGGGGFLLAQTLDPTLVNVKAKDGTVGLACLRYNCNYNLRLRDCRLGGSDAGVSLYAAIGNSLGTDIVGGGITSIRETGGSMTWIGTMATAVGPMPETGCDLWEGQFGGQEAHTGVSFDNEIAAFSKAAYRVENMAYQNRSLVITNGAVARLAPGARVFELNSRPEPQYPPAHLSVRGFVVQNVNPGAVTVGGPAGRWFGDIDARGWPPSSVITPLSTGGNGPGFDPSRLVIKTAP